MVVRLGSGGYQKEDSLPTTRYDDENEARMEAERLATKYPNHPRGFAVVKAISIVRAEVSILGFNLDEGNISMNPFFKDALPTIPCHY